MLDLLLLYFLKFNSKKYDFLLKMSNYAEECLKKYVKTRETFQV